MGVIFSWLGGDKHQYMLNVFWGGWRHQAKLSWLLRLFLERLGPHVDPSNVVMQFEKLGR